MYNHGVISIGRTGSFAPNRPSSKANPLMKPTNTAKLTTDADRVIGSRIAALRTAQGLSQTALGHAIGVSFQQVQKYEKGRNRVGASRLQMIADHFKVPVEIFFASVQGNDDRAGSILAFFNDPKVVRLILAFTSIPDETIRENILSIVKAAAAIQQDTSLKHKGCQTDRSLPSAGTACASGGAYR